MTRRVALLGTGLMGAPMAQNLLRGGHDVTVWNRTRSKAEPLAADGAVVTDTVPEAVEGAEAIITMLSDGATTLSIVNDPEVRAALAEGAVWIEMSSVSPAEAQEQAASLREIGVGHVDAPVSGGTRGAETATLAIMAGGDAETVLSVETVFTAMGRLTHVGPSGTGQLSKLANQAIVAITAGAVAEAMLLVERGGGDPAAVRAALAGGFADSKILQEHGERMTERNFVPGGPAKFQIKDLGNIQSTAEEAGVALPLVTEMQRRFVKLINEMGHGEDDMSAIYIELLEQNGLTP